MSPPTSPPAASVGQSVSFRRRPTQRPSGGNGGLAQGGGLYLAGVTSATLRLYYVNSNIAWGGSGGTGGSGSINSTAYGGNAGAGGCGGWAQGGGLFTCASTVADTGTYILSNIALGGNGGSTGVPGIGTTVGADGAGGAAGTPKAAGVSTIAARSP